MKRAHAVFSFRCCSKNSSDFPTWWSKVAAVISSSFVREKSSSPPRFHGFRMRCARWRVFSRVKCRFLDGQHCQFRCFSRFFLLSHLSRGIDSVSLFWSNFADWQPTTNSSERRVMKPLIKLSATVGFLLVIAPILRADSVPLLFPVGRADLVWTATDAPQGAKITFKNNSQTRTYTFEFSARGQVNPDSNPRITLAPLQTTTIDWPEKQPFLDGSKLWIDGKEPRSSIDK
jgi:hypothetical protein